MSPEQPVERITVQVDEPYQAEVDVAGLERAITMALISEGQPEGEVTLVVTSDEAVHALNLQFLGEDRPTDVLSFPANGPATGGDEAGAFVAAPEAASYLGDIIIAYPYARRQAEGLGRAVTDELRLLAVHGTLHLLGYDHAEPDEEADMWARQDAILAHLAAS